MSFEILMLGHEYGAPALQRAVSAALEFGCSDVAAVHLLLRAERTAPRSVPDAVEIGSLHSYDRPLPTLANYDQSVVSGDSTRTGL